MDPLSFDRLPRDELVAKARSLGVERPELMTRVELGDEIVRRTQSDPGTQRQARGWLGVARDLVASVVESGLNLPDAAAIIRGERGDGDPAGPAPVATVTLAEIYATQGHLDRALRMVEEVLAREPDHPAALALLERLRAEPGRRRTTSNLAELSEKARAPATEAPPSPSAPPAETVASSEPPPIRETAPAAVAEPQRTGEPSPAPQPLLAAVAPLTPVEPPGPAAANEPTPQDLEPGTSSPSADQMVQQNAAAAPPSGFVVPEPAVSAGAVDGELALEPAAEQFAPASEAEPVPPSSEAEHTPVPLAVRAPPVEPGSAPEPIIAESVPPPLLTPAEPAPVTAPTRNGETELAALLIVRTREAHPALCWSSSALVSPSGAPLEIECLGFSAGRAGSIRRELALAVPATRGSVVLSEFDAETLVRAALGYREAGSFFPLVIASELIVLEGGIEVRYRPPLSSSSSVTELERTLVNEFAAAPR